MTLEGACKGLEQVRSCTSQKQKLTRSQSPLAIPEEKRLGWIWQDPDQNLEGKVFAKRFWLQQKNKIRVSRVSSVCGSTLPVAKKSASIHMQSTRCAPILLGHSLNKNVALATSLLENF